ncbi:hypothetical protein [Luteolibacter luteus]|uniref:DUF2304 domain-containing protein n=1 Tax=Luteolibacter luteus TaxID=2728835 RepID=A0A858RH22_9BACT|nr:hypothetical protein [Luteolibacter luteus]QJE95739.1 hypothetical protein HHL09_08050 [Luteolibacter luteus]
MASTAVSLLGLVLMIAMIAGLWVGVLGLRQAGRNGAWWTMMLAVCGITLGTLGFAGLTFALSTSLAGGSGGAGMAIFGIFSMLVPFSVLLFIIGFAIHGLKTARVNQRIRELEQLTEAMSEEINRLREGRMS